MCPFNEIIWNCDEFPDLFKQELGCLKDFELEVKFKTDAVPVIHQARPVPFALRDDLVKSYEEGIVKGVWKPVQFNEYWFRFAKHALRAPWNPSYRFVVTIQWASTINWKIIVTHCHSLKNWCRNWEVDSGTPRLTRQLPTTRSSWHQKVNSDYPSALTVGYSCSNNFLSESSQHLVTFRRSWRTWPVIYLELPFSRTTCSPAVKTPTTTWATWNACSLVWTTKDSDVVVISANSHNPVCNILDTPCRLKGSP